MLFEDNQGNILTSEEIDDMAIWEMDDINLHVYE